MALQRKEKSISDLSQIIISFEVNFVCLRLFNKIFNHFPWVKINVINIKEKLDEYKEKLKEYQANFKHRFVDLESFKSIFAYFVNPFICDIIEDGFSISEIILTEKVAGELELL